MTPGDATRGWIVPQAAVWLLGAALIAALFLAPAVGIHACWNVLIPVAPALLVLAPGLWRNICPLATTAQLPRRAGFGGTRPATAQAQGWLALAGVALLTLVVPVRHVLLDTHGPATAITLLAIGALALGMGLIFEGKSGWCAGLCPIHPVERLYGHRPALALPNGHCASCLNCVTPCPDSVPDGWMTENGGWTPRTVALVVLVGAFPGYVWGWFQVADARGGAGWADVAQAYAWPFAGAALTLAFFLGLRSALHDAQRRRLIRVWAAAAVATYYWYRVPMLFGFGPFPGDGMLVDLTAALPAAFPVVSRVATTLFFAWWLVLRLAPRREWCVRPALAPAVAARGVVR